ncbi:MAG: hypothetical protein U0R52_01660 [Solirubrobacterales bacterium]
MATKPSGLKDCRSESLLRAGSAPASGDGFKVVAQTRRVSTLYYLAGDAGTLQYWAAQTNGKHRRLIFSVDEGNGLIRPNRNGGWTPCCARIYAFGREERNGARLIHIGVDGRGKETLPGRLPPSYDGDEVSQRSGRSVIDEGLGASTHLVLMERNGTRRTIWSPPNGDVYGPDSPAISPSGTSIAFTTYDTNPWQPCNYPQLDVISSTGSGFHSIYQGQDQGRSPEDLSFSVQGGRMVFTDSVGISETCNVWPSNESRDIYLANTLGSGARRITDTTLTDEEQPILNPQATQIAFTTEQSGDLYIVPTGGGHPRHFAHLRISAITPYVWLDTRWQRRKRVRH